MNENRFYVYLYSYPDGQPFYVGKGCGRRMRVHICDAKAGRNSDKWCVRVISKLLREGEKPIISVVQRNLTNDEAVSLEIELISKYGRRDLGTGVLVNCTDGGDGANNVTPEIRTKQTEVLLNSGVNYRYSKGSIPWNKGCKTSLETKEKQKLKKLGHKQKEETKIKRSEALTGYKHKIVKCPHCGIEGGATTMYRWHFNRCSGAKHFRARLTINGKRIHLGRFATQEEANFAIDQAKAS